MKKTNRFQEMSKFKKIVLSIGVLCLAFGLYNVIWFGWRACKYNSYTENLDVFIEHLSYVYTAEDGYLYNVKMPDYLTFTGNLCVATPDGGAALLIWPKVLGGYRYGFQIEKDNEIYSIMLNQDFEAEDAQFKDIIDENNNVITELNSKAIEMWHIKN